MKGPPMNFLMYIRPRANISKSECLDMAVDISNIRQFADQHGYKIVGIIIDTDETAKCDEKTRYEDIRRYLDEHGNVDAVITTTKLIGPGNYVTLKTLLEREGKSLFLAPRQPVTKSP